MGLKNNRETIPGSTSTGGAAVSRRPHTTHRRRPLGDENSPSSHGGGEQCTPGAPPAPPRCAQGAQKGTPRRARVAET